MASNLTDQVRNIAEVDDRGRERRPLAEDHGRGARARSLELEDTINTMVDQLSSFADEVTRVAREVGTEGKLGGQADVHGVSGTWKDLTDNVNSMAGNLTGQVRNIAEVDDRGRATATSRKKITVDVRRARCSSSKTRSTRWSTSSRASPTEVTRVAREVGTEGKLGGQAKVPGVVRHVAGLTDNVNQLAGDLTTQVRAIADVSTAVT